MLNHIIRESIRKHLSWKWWDGDACGLALKDVPEVLEVGVASANLGLGDVEEGHVGATFNFVGCVLWDAGFGRMGYWIFDLAAPLVNVVLGEEWKGVKKEKSGQTQSGKRSKIEVAYLNLKEVLWLAVDLLKGLLARIWHGLHCDGGSGAAARGSDVCRCFG